MSKELLFWMQMGGGIFYLLNKIFFSLKERAIGNRARRWRIWAWLVYIVGLPFWLAILGYENNWMVFLVEIGGLPAMLLGLLMASSSADIKPGSSLRQLEWGLDFVSRLMAVMGIIISLVSVGLMDHLTQWAELGVTAGFLIGTYRLAKDKLDGYLWFLLMNASAGWLMYLQGYYWLTLQQALSLAFVIDAYFIRKAKDRWSKGSESAQFGKPEYKTRTIH